MTPDIRSLSVGNHRLPCPQCDKTPRDKALSVDVRADSCVWFCHRCGYKGHVRDARYPAPERTASPRRAIDDLAIIERIREQWQDASIADAMHPYLRAKGIAPTNWRQIDNQLLVPLYRDDWELCSVQRIYPDGVKRFPKGLTTRGLFYVAHQTDRPARVNLCEGAATAVVIAARTVETTVAAMSRTNLLAVGQSLRRRFSNRPITVWADNDHRTPGNPGMVDAITAATHIGASVTWPIFMAGSAGTDFLDMWQEQARAA